MDDTKLATMDQNSKEKFHEAQKLVQRLAETTSVVRGIDQALDEISNRLPKDYENSTLISPVFIAETQADTQGLSKQHNAKTPCSGELFNRSSIQTRNNDGVKEKPQTSSQENNPQTFEATSLSDSKRATGKIEDIVGLLRALDATFLAKELEKGDIPSDVCELLPSQRLPAKPVCLQPVVCNNCKENGCCVTPRPESRVSIPIPNSPVTARVNETPLPRTIMCSSYCTNFIQHRDNRSRCQSICVKMNLMPRNQSKPKGSKDQSNKSTNAKQMRWGENTVIRDDDPTYHSIFNQMESLPSLKYVKQKLKEERDKSCRLENRTPMPTDRNKTPQHIKDILVELPPIPNDLLERDAFGNNDLCGWFQWQQPLLRQDVKCPGNHQIVKKTNRKVWYNPQGVDSTKECYYGVQGNHRLPFLYESAHSNLKRLPRAELCNFEQNVVQSAYDEETSSLDLGEDLYGQKLHSRLITLPIDQSVVVQRKRPKAPKLPPLKCTAVIKASTGDPRTQWDSWRSNGIMDEISIDNGSAREKRRPNSPVVSILKPLPMKETKQTKQLINWCHRNVGHIKIPPLDLNALDAGSNSEPNTERREFLSNVLQKTPRERNEIKQEVKENKAVDQDPLKTDETIAIPNVRQLLNVFDKTAQQKMDLPVCLLGDKIETTLLCHPRVRMSTETPIKEFRYRRSDVPIDLVRLALRSKTANKGVYNVTSLLQNMPQNTCKRSSKKTTRKSLKHQEKVKVCLEKDNKIEQELKKLRNQLKENKKASRMLNGNFYGIDTERSGVARPSTPITM